MTAPLRKAISWLAAHVAPKRLHTIQVPTLIVIGEHDVLDCQAIAETLHRRIPNARKAVMAPWGTCQTWRRRNDSMRSYRTSWRPNDARPNFRRERSGEAPAGFPTANKGERRSHERIAWTSKAVL